MLMKDKWLTQNSRQFFDRRMILFSSAHTRESSEDPHVLSRPWYKKKANSRKIHAKFHAIAHI
jgi:hypothetical protein